MTAKMITTSFTSESGWYWGCFMTSIVFSPRRSCCWVALSRSEPNCANAASSRYCARSALRPFTTALIAFVWASPPTRETERPMFIAGRMP